MGDILLQVLSFYISTAGSSHGVSSGNKSERERAGGCAAIGEHTFSAIEFHVFPFHTLSRSATVAFFWPVLLRRFQVSGLEVAVMIYNRFINDGWDPWGAWGDIDGCRVFSRGSRARPDRCGWRWKRSLGKLHLCVVAKRPITCTTTHLVKHFTSSARDPPRLPPATRHRAGHSPTHRPTFVSHFYRRKNARHSHKYTAQSENMAGVGGVAVNSCCQSPLWPPLHIPPLLCLLVVY